MINAKLSHVICSVYSKYSFSKFGILWCTIKMLPLSRTFQNMQHAAILLIQLYANTKWQQF